MPQAHSLYQYDGHSRFYFENGSFRGWGTALIRLTIKHQSVSKHYLIHQKRQLSVSLALLFVI